MALSKTSISAATLGLDWAAAITTDNVRVGNPIDLNTTKVVSLGIRYELGRSNGTAFTNSPRIRIQLSDGTSGSDWAATQIIYMGLGASIANTTLNGAISAGATSCVVTSGTNITAGEMLYLGHTTTTANYEVLQVKSVSGTTVNFEEACVNAHDNGCLVTGQAERGFVQIDVTGAMRARVMIDTENIVGGGLFSRVAAVISAVS